VYPVSVDHPGNRGILNKMEYQRSTFSKLTGPVDVICNSIRGPLVNGDLAGRYPITGRGFNSLNHYALFYAHVTRLARRRNYDFLYIRYPFAIPGFLGFLRRAKGANPSSKVIVEIATFPYLHELQTPKQRILGLLDHLGHDRLKKHVDAIVTFYGQSEIYGIPCIQSRNGVDVQRLPLRRRRQSADELAMITVGNLAERHGIDRVLCGMALYVRQPDSRRVTLHVVGDGPALPDLVTLAAKLGIEEHVRFHGMKSGTDLDAAFEDADIALDSLGLHRLHLPSSSSLKAREYCARGIPFVLASHDPDFPPELPFVLHVPSTDDPLDISTMVEFSAEVQKKHPTNNRDMRSYAGKRLTWEAKLEPLAQFLEAELNGGGIEELVR